MNNKCPKCGSPNYAPINLELGKKVAVVVNCCADCGYKWKEKTK